jgi:hypothetical protein
MVDIGWGGRPVLGKIARKLPLRRCHNRSVLMHVGMPQIHNWLGRPNY